MAKDTTLKNADDYEPLVAKELEYYGQLAAEVGVSDAVLREAARLGVRDGIYRHRHAQDCKNREADCVAYNIRHFVDITLVRACLMASSEEEMEKAEVVLMRLIED